MPLKNNLKCLGIIKQNHTKKIDVGQLNNEYFLNVAGLGFDAIIAHKFATSKRRGKLPYFKIGIKEFFNFKAEKYTLTFEGEIKKEIAPMVLTVANGTQYGCDFHIAPKALLDDGFLDMVEIKPTNILKLLLGLPNFLKEGLTPVHLTEIQKIQEIDIEGKAPFYYHIDGEPRVCESGKLKIKTLPKSLIILMPEK